MQAHDRFEIFVMLRRCLKTKKGIIAKYEAIPDEQNGYKSSLCVVWDCFVPRNDDFIKAILNLSLNPQSSCLA
jgi:hypothetical protein